METDFSNISVIIPLAPGDAAWRDLLQDLALLPGLPEVILAAAEDASSDFEQFNFPFRMTWRRYPKGRAHQLNAGASAATRDWLWFLHADSRVTVPDARTLLRSIFTQTHAIHYFNLKFDQDGPPIMILNTAGAWLRSRLLLMPYGDQGFCLQKETFKALGGFDEVADYGEDHLLVWSARRRGLPIRCTGGWITTSARRYRESGWAQTTFRHMKLGAVQAFPEARGLIMKRLERWRLRLFSNPKAQESDPRHG